MTEAAALARSTTLRLHYLTGLIVLVFVAQHLLVHLFALAGSDAHNAALKLVQLGYRNPVVEPLLVLALLFQIGLGLRLAFRRLREPGKSGWAKWQIASGFYLALFLFNHTTAALMTRFVSGCSVSTVASVCRTKSPKRLGGSMSPLKRAKRPAPVSPAAQRA